MLRSRTALALVTICLVLAGCGEGDAATDVEIADLAGSWNATEFRFTDTSGRTIPGTGSAPSLDVTSFGGVVTMVIQESGGFTGTINVPTVTPGDVPLSGTITLLGPDSLAVDFDQQTLSLICPAPEDCLFGSFTSEFTLRGNVLTLVNDDTTFDFAPVEPLYGLEPAGPVSASLTIRFER